MDLVIDGRGGITCVYGEDIPLQELGNVTIRRASHVEPDTQGGRTWRQLAVRLSGLLTSAARRLMRKGFGSNSGLPAHSQLDN